MTGYLVAEEGPLAGLVIEFSRDEVWTLGRDPDESSIILEDPMVSRHHATCRLTPEGVLLENTSQVNPVTQNGRIVTEPVLLREGDILQIGSTFFRFTQTRPATEAEIEPTDGFAELEDLTTLHRDMSGPARWLLKVISGPNAGAEFNMRTGGSYLLGKDPALCDILFQDLSVSRQHAKIWVDDQAQIFVEDLGSRNGVVVNGETIAGIHPIASQDLISLGTTSFLVIDREEVHETIYSPPSTVASTEEVAAGTAAGAPGKAAQAADWHQLVIPRKHLIGAGIFGLFLLVGTVSLLSLFHGRTVEVEQKDFTAQIHELLQGFPDVQFSFNAPTGKLFLTGHVLTSVDQQQLLYNLSTEPYIRSVEDTVVVDELVWQNTNALLATNPAWVGVSIMSPAPGRFVLRGYLTSNEDAEALSDYIHRVFPYLDRLDNQVVVEGNLALRIQSLLTMTGLNGVAFNLSNGEVVFTGFVDGPSSHHFKEVIAAVKQFPGVRLVDNFVVLTTADTSSVDLSSKYKVTGYSRRDDGAHFVVVGGRILSVGDDLDGMQISAITSTTIQMEKDGVKFKVNYNLQ